MVETPEADRDARRRRWLKEYQIDRVRSGGKLRRVDNLPARAHVRALMRQGHGVTAIARAAGVSHDAVRDLLGRRKRKTMQKRTYLAIMSVQPSALLGSEGGEKVPAVGVIRRVRALQSRGWPVEHIGAESGVTHLRVILSRGPEGRVFASTHEMIAVLYEQYRWLWGPSSWSALWAQRNNIPPPEAWDEDTIDDPGAEPAPVEPQRWEGVRTRDGSSKRRAG